MNVQWKHGSIMALLAVTLVPASVLLSPCDGEEPYVIQGVQQVQLPDFGRLVTATAAQSQDSEPAFGPIVEASVRAIAQGLEQGRSIGMPAPNGADAIPGADVPDPSDEDESVPATADEKYTTGGWFACSA